MPDEFGGDANNGSEMKRGLVISDLHLFSPRSEGSRLLAERMDEVTQTDVLVLNGDVFDFRWSELPDQSATISAAIDWLKKLLENFQGESIHYVLGNHDCLSAFTSRLDELAQANPMFSCHEHRLIINRSLFLHGDCANRMMDENMFKQYRRAWSSHRQRGKVGKTLYQIADITGLSRRFHEQHFPQAATVERVAHHLNHIFPAWREEIDDVFFGHTHRPFTSHTHEGVNFHNTGSGIRSMGFLPLSFLA